MSADGWVAACKTDDIDEEDEDEDDDEDIDICELELDDVTGHATCVVSCIELLARLGSVTPSARAVNMAGPATHGELTRYDKDMVRVLLSPDCKVQTTFDPLSSQ